eukprot:m.123944 g.123944  ORF g.123944 m.123944 type:complete len:477 (-) comp14459_c1_seq14:60-1490(-)
MFSLTHSQRIAWLFRNGQRGFSVSSKGAGVNVAVIGSGPGGFYTAQNVMKAVPNTRVDIFERLPVPYGLVRYGVAPDHQDVKNVTSQFESIALSENCNFFGGVQVGKDVSIQELRDAYNLVVCAYGAQTDRKLGIQNESVNGVYSARDFVGWYNGLPEDTHLNPPLDCETAVVFGHGNVALDVARMLLAPISHLEKTDIAPHALEALAASKVKNVHLVGRRGPLEASFTIKELREMTRMNGVQTFIDPEQMKFSESELEFVSKNRVKKRITTLMQTVSQEDQRNEEKSLFIDFFSSPKRVLCDGEQERMKGVEFEITTVDETTRKAVGTGKTKQIECGLAFRSIGYKGMPLFDDIPFDQGAGVIDNNDGRVKGVPGMYCSGWIRTGPVGVIASTMSAAFNTAASIVSDIKDGNVPQVHNSPDDVVAKLKGNPKVLHFNDWLAIDKVERERGVAKGRPRVKVTDISEMYSIASKTAQ